MTEFDKNPAKTGFNNSIVGRPDLDDDAILQAVNHRLVRQRTSQGDARSVLAAARAGDADALSMLRTIDLPLPVARLSMPTQRLSAAKGSKRSSARSAFSWFLSPLRG